MRGRNDKYHVDFSPISQEVKDDRVVRWYAHVEIGSGLVRVDVLPIWYRVLLWNVVWRRRRMLRLHCC